MKIKVTATVLYPVYINQEIEVESEDNLREAILDLADTYIKQGGVDPLITESNIDSIELD